MPDGVLIFGTRHLGRAVGRHFAAQGAHVGLVSRDPAHLARAVAEVGAEGGQVWGMPGDLTDPGTAARAATRMIETWGFLHLAVNATAPPFTPRPVPVVDLDDAALRAGLDTTVWGALRFLQEVGGVMGRARGGCLVQVGATAALRVREGFGALAAAQAAMRALTLAAARELRPRKVHVAHVVCDGIIESKKTRELALGTGVEAFLSEADIANAIDYIFLQDARAWSHELVLRPSAGEWTASI
ncbi:MAG TPA: SDR family oxidoreductase [Myxococcota bacterium]|nr:SDR family oxidoreductase [Myxococcota bacterium]